MTAYPGHQRDDLPAWRVRGPADGHAVFHCHGVPGSALEPAMSEQWLAEAGIRVIAFDRPGYGESPPRGNYSLRAHAADLAALADHLGIERFALFGFSGGGQFALAAAAHLRARVSRLVLAGTPAPLLLADPFADFGALTANAYRQARDRPSVLATELQGLTRDERKLGDTLLASLSDSDQHRLSAGAAGPAFRANMRRVVAGGGAAAARAMARDIALLMTAPEFEPAAVEQPVHVFHGADDRLLTPRHARALVAALPHARLEIEAEAGHYGALLDTPAPRLLAAAVADERVAAVAPH